MPARHSTRCQHMRFTSSQLGTALVTPRRDTAPGSGLQPSDSAAGEAGRQAAHRRPLVHYAGLRGQQRFERCVQPCVPGSGHQEGTRAVLRTPRMAPKLRMVPRVVLRASPTLQAVHDDGLACRHGQPGAPAQLLLQLPRAPAAVARQQHEVAGGGLPAAHKRAGRLHAASVHALRGGWGGVGALGG